MARILITSGPTRQYLDPVRYLTNASSGRMGRALATAAITDGHEVVVVTGPVHVTYPADAQIVRVISTEQMLEASLDAFPHCDGLIAAAAPCDYRPLQVASDKITKTGEPLTLKLIETPDIVAALGDAKRPGQWLVGFALETRDQRIRAQVKLEKKRCNLMVVNGPRAIDADTNEVEVMDRHGHVIASLQGPKQAVAEEILKLIQQRLVNLSSTDSI